jgi:hypothetical protein
MTDGYVGLPADSVGKKADTSELTVGNYTVERQRINLADPAIAAGLQRVSTQGNAAVIDSEALELQRQVLLELRVITTILAHGFNVEADNIRNTFSRE